jgi:5-methylcytosine-specific restriction endonuclease McrA
MSKQRFCKWCEKPLEEGIKKVFCSYKCYNKNYYQENKEKLLKSAKEFRNSPFGRKYRKKYFYEYFHSERGKNARKKYLQSPKGKIHKKMQSKRYNNSQRAKEVRKFRDHTLEGKKIKKLADKKYRQTEGGKLSEKKYFQSPKGKITKFRAYCKRKRNYPIDLSIEDAEFIKQRDGMRCVYCGIEIFEYPTVSNGHSHQSTYDHIIKDGVTAPSNIVLACRDCNNSKKDKDVFEWCKEKGFEVPKIVVELLTNNSFL